jgi:predicted nuclease of predicted toxin-antitoxin system
MKFLIDAQLPRKLASWMHDAGHDVKHTLDLPLGNRTPDSVIVTLAQSEDRVVVTKDDDFVQSHLISERPARLLLISTGNIGNKELGQLLRTNLDAIVGALGHSRFVELSRHALTLHD